jgi:hypothetical protein
MVMAFIILFGSLSLAQIPDYDEIYSEQGLFMSPMGTDPGIPDTITVESKVIPLGTTEFSLDVYLYNDEELGGFNLPVGWDSPDITCDSVSFVGSRVEYVNIKLFAIDSVNQRLQAGMVIFFEDYLQPGNGMIYTAYFSVDPGAVDQYIVFDSTFYPPGGNFALTLGDGFNFIPQYVEGIVTLGNPSNPVIGLDPTEFSFTGTEGAGNPPTQTLNISNEGTGTLEWSLTNNNGWLTLDPMAGAGDSAVDVGVNLTGLSAGIYYDTIVVTANSDNSPLSVPVVLVVEPPQPTIQLDPTSINVSAFEGSTLPSEEITVTNVGDGTLDWTAVNITSWLSLDPTNGVGDGSITAEFDLTGLTEGAYYDTITVSDENATNSPQMTVVNLIVNAASPPPPQIGLSPTEFTFYAISGGSNPSSKTLTITNLGGGELNWIIEEAEDWLTVDPSSGSGDGSAEVSVDITGLAMGTYPATISVIDPGAVNSPQTADVTLIVSDADGFELGTAVIYPAAQHVFRAYAIDPRMDTIYIGDFDSYQVGDIDPSSILVNLYIPPASWAILPSHPGFTGEVMEVVVEAKDFIESYGLLWDTTVHSFTVSGDFNDQAMFQAVGEVTFFGHTSGDANSDGIVDVGDPLFIIDYIFREGPAPDPMIIGDVNCDGRVNIGDSKFLLNYVFLDGPKPECQQ